MNSDVNIEQPIPLMELAFRATLQIQIREPESIAISTPHGLPILRTEDVWGYGSAFLIKYQDRHFFVTADHNIHPDDHSPDNATGQRTKRDYKIDIITNVKGPEISCILQPIGGFLHLTGLSFDNDFDAKSENAREILIKVFEELSNGNIDINDESIPLGCRIHDLIDIAVSEIKRPIEVPLLSNQVVVNEEVIVNQGAAKLILHPERVFDLEDKTRCVVAGTVLNKLINGETQLNRVNAIYEIVYDAYQSNSDYMFFRCDSYSEIKYWSGLSGAPVLREDGLLVGMLVNGPSDNGMVAVIPINKILQTIDYHLKVESIGK